MVSRGLRRFGLPEIVVRVSPCGHGLCTAGFVRTVADSLLTSHFDWLAAHPTAMSRTIDDRLLIEDLDIRLGWLEPVVTPGPGKDPAGCLEVSVAPSAGLCVMTEPTALFTSRARYGT
ncbi:hypothetical protein DP939_19840 [Spongiactinospora rosea]|uniref:Uncharacterized protein n=1 Tax=Spongiactinospora rosea TaxID=2248750 RepID=A0A366LXS8_9ACTN|nr:hypothetical protein [Spongiactinospora rosea]RBQ18159.1 hypothetical protein DP939_19840 [Spongiactinospora rosea]